MPWIANPDKKASAECGQCGVIFTFYKSTPKRFCSQACADLSTHVDAICPSCGVQFTFTKSWPRIYCSHRCAGKTTVENTRTARKEPVSTRCTTCGKSFVHQPTSRRRFCSRLCWWTWRKTQTAIKRDTSPPRHPYGRPRVTLNCEQCSAQFTVPATEVTAPKKAGRPRAFCSRTCWNTRRSLVQSGANSPNWKGGHPYGPSWIEARDAVRARDNVCVDCGRPPKPHRALDVHHLVPFRTFGFRQHKMANRLSNLVALCTPCHIKREWVLNPHGRKPFEQMPKRTLRRN